jgi:PAS domain S-box-containing protein
MPPDDPGTRLFAAVPQTVGPQPLKILILENDPAEAALMQRALHEAGLGFTARRVATRAAFVKALESFMPDVVLLGYKLPDFGGAEALTHARRVHPEIPIVIVTGSLGDEQAIELLKCGAKDYVLKGNLVRLASAVERAVGVEYGIRARKAAEKALRRSEERYRTLVAATTQLAWTTDGEGKVVEDVPLWRAFTGQSYAEIRNDGWADALHSDDRAAAIDAWGQARRTRRPYQIEYRLRRRDGAYRDMSVHGVPVKEADGSIREWIGTCIDITERKQAEERIREEEAKFRSLVEQQIAGIYIIAADGTIAYVNPRFAAMFGYMPDEVIGRPMLDFIAEPDRAAVVENFAAQMAGSQPSSEIAAAIRAKNGTLVEVLAQGSRTTYGGRPASIGVILDMTERNRAGIELRQSRQLLEGILNAIPVRVFWKDANLVYLGCNAAFAHDAGFATPADVVGKDDYQMGWRDQSESYRRYDRQIIASGCPQLLVEETQTTANGESRALLTNKMPLRGATGKSSACSARTWTSPSANGQRRRSARTAQSSAALSSRTSPASSSSGTMVRLGTSTHSSRISSATRRPI